MTCRPTYMLLPAVSSDWLREGGFRFAPIRNISLNRLAMAGSYRCENRPDGKPGLCSCTRCSPRTVLYSSRE